MPPSPPILDAHEDDHLKQYISSVHGLHSKIARISANQLEVAASLSRAAATLRSLAEYSRAKTAANSGN